MYLMLSEYIQTIKDMLVFAETQNGLEFCLEKFKEETRGGDKSIFSIMFEELFQAHRKIVLGNILYRKEEFSKIEETMISFEDNQTVHIKPSVCKIMKGMCLTSYQKDEESKFEKTLLQYYNNVETIHDWNSFVYQELKEYKCKVTNFIR